MSKQAYRLAVGGRIDRTRPISFRFDDKLYSGYVGDTLASALLANGVHLVGRGFKYHRPRGILSAGSEEPNALVQLGTGGATDPNLRATQVELYDELVAASQNCWPSLSFDLGAVNSLFSRVLPAGFYYKTFMWPKGFWKYYEYFIRRAAGLGRAPDAPDPARYDNMHAHCDVLVVGGGVTGLAAALSAARTDARVILADEQCEFGGGLLGAHEQIDGMSADEWVAQAVAELASMKEVTLLPRSTVTGYFDHNFLTVAERIQDHLGPMAAADKARQRLWKVRAKQVVLATGAHERPMVFRNNDRPGIMLASAAGTYVNRFAVKPGNSAVFFTNSDSAYGAALTLAEAGIKVAAVIDVRAQPTGMLPTKVRDRGIEILGRHAIAAAVGKKRVSAVEVMALNESADCLIGTARKIPCDLVCMSAGWSPAVHLFSQSRSKLKYDANRSCFVPGDSFQAERSAGAANGTFSFAACLTEGHEAGLAAAADAGYKKKGRVPKAPMTQEIEETPVHPLWLVPAKAGEHTDKHFVDFQNDVTAADVVLAAREGYRSVEHLKRYTTMGMGTDQGKTSNVNALAIFGQVLGSDISEVGTTTFRPPYTPVTFGVLAGRDVGELADPIRRTPMYQWHESKGAKFEDVGQWRRPWYYPLAGESMQDAVNRECLATRKAIGILDASTLGKIDIQGPDAAELLNRIYTNGWKKLAIGRCRYGIMCGEDGMVFDDGVTARLGENHYRMTTTSGNAARVFAWLEEWLQTEWPELKVYCNSVTEHWATASVAGPLARKLVAKLTSDIDFDPDNFPFMSFREGTVAGIPARVFRISFTGEVSFEINVPLRYGLALWNTLMTVGEQYGITPFGTEAIHVLRAEKGFIIAGQETDGTVTPIDLGLESMVSKRKDFIGKRSLSRPDTQREDRKQLVGLLPVDRREVLPEGSQIVEKADDKPPMAMIGHVTSSYYSAYLERSIALALIKRGRSRHGETVQVPLEDKVVPAKISEPQFYDPEGVRING
ncbi:MAG: sarcosine oxidase subunit alpha [Gammaproteobacteria bacterium]|nr:sarcosine oxidase subunit alpha [Pseudomonadota bacterium]MCZ6732168.1 sarcosine oxidase subunit alpha [Gammaproteobacteria bacterium]